MTAKVMQLVRAPSAPPPKRSCNFCQRELLAIELYCRCPKFKLEWGLLQLRIEARREAQARLAARPRRQRSGRP